MSLELGRRKKSFMNSPSFHWLKKFHPFWMSCLKFHLNSKLKAHYSHNCIHVKQTYNVPNTLLAYDEESKPKIAHHAIKLGHKSNENICSFNHALEYQNIKSDIPRMCNQDIILKHKIFRTMFMLNYIPKNLKSLIWF